MDAIQITLTLFNRPFKVKVLPQSEQALRSAVKQMNENIDTYKKSYPGREDFDYLAMAVMTLVSDMPAENTESTSENVIHALKKVDDLLSS
jgi:Cell division protein ZapA